MPDWTSSILRPVWDAIGALLLAGGGAAIITIGIMRLFGESWLNHRFARKMSQFTHEQDQQIERLRLEINTLFDRMTKLHAREFEVVPEAWSMLVDADRYTRALIASFQSYPDFSRYREDELEEFLEKSPLSEIQKRDLRKSSDKTKFYMQAIFWHRNSEARKAYLEARIFHSKNGIFLEDDLDRQFKKAIDLLWGALLEREHNEQYPDARPLSREAHKALQDEGTLLMDQIRAQIRKRLRASPED